MAATDWLKIVGNTTLTDGGFVGDLMQTARAHIDDALMNNRLTQDQAGEVYTAMITAAFQQATQFALQRELTGAQVDDVNASIALKKDQLKLERDKTEAELEKQWGYAVTRDTTTDELILGASDGSGLIDKQVLEAEDSTIRANTQLTDQLSTSAKQRQEIEASTAIKEQQKLTEAQSTSKAEFEVTTLLPDQHTTNIKQQTLLDTQEQSEQYKVNNILPAQLSQTTAQTDEVTDSTSRANTQLNDSLLTSTKQREGIIQDNLVKVQEVLKAKFEVDSLLPKQLDKMQEDMHNQEWNRTASALKIKLDAAVSLYNNKRSDKLPAIVADDASATTLYDTLVSDIPA